MKKEISYVFFVFLLCLLMWICPKTSRAGRYAADFLNIGAGASALALGGAVVAHVNDATATYWNPAALSRVGGRSVALMYAPRFENLERYSFFGFANHLGRFGAVGLSWIRLGIDDIPIYGPLIGTHFERLSNPILQPSSEPEGFLQDIEQAFLVSYALSIDREGKPQSQQLRIGTVPFNLSFGATAKYIRQSIGDTRGTGFGVNLGLHLRAETSIGRVALGMVVRDAFTTKIRWNTASQHEDILWGSLRAGVGYVPKIPMLSDFIFLFELTSRDGIRVHGGIEYRLANRIAFRAGFDGSDPTFGAGLVLGSSAVDYAFTRAALANSHQVSLQLQF